MPQREFKKSMSWEMLWDTVHKLAQMSTETLVLHLSYFY